LTRDTPTYRYHRSTDQAGGVARRKVIVIGAGPVGLTVAIDLARHGVRTVVIDDGDTVSAGSRAICWAKRTLEIWDRLGCAAPMMEKGITWHTGKVFFGAEPVFGFDLLPETGHGFPAFINLQQYHVEQILVAHAERQLEIELRWKNKLVALHPRGDGMRLTIETPDGPYDVDADWVIACDGARSQARRLLGLDFKGRVFEDRFLIADVKVDAKFPTERWFWFDPTFHAGGSALVHRQADDLWRIDLQLGWDADPELEKRPERVMPRLKAMFGPDVACEATWVSIYTFQCRRLERFRHGRVIFAGDSAHQVSPFGARGGNSGLQDADNLAWKLALVLQGAAPERLIDSYDAERAEAADENILASTRATDFITPKNATSKRFRDATLSLARSQPFARRLINSGRLSIASVHRSSPLSTPDGEHFAGALAPGAPAVDAPVVREGFASWLLRWLGGRFTALLFAEEIDAATAAGLAALAQAPIPVAAVVVAPRPIHAPADVTALIDPEGVAAARYDGAAGTTYLLRPDQLIAARWRRFDPAAIAVALTHAIGRP
jgi:3-(3-hydroxy-phenyl)propionate hydroxylase